MRQCRERYDERGTRWQRDFSSLEAYSRSVAPNRERLLSMIGGWPWERGPLEPSIEEIATTDTYTASRVFFTSFDDVRVDAILIRPHGDGPFPAVLAQHGVNHTPEQICGFCEPEHSAAYHELGVRLAKHGYVVIAPRMIGGYGENRFNVPNIPSLRKQEQGRAQNQINRKAILIGQSIQALEYFTLSRAVDYLETLPEVDNDRIGLYGLSRGGRAALWLGALEQRLQAVVSSAWFNERFSKMLQPELIKVGAFIETSSEFQFIPNLFREFGDADIASLICPRAFFVEDGKHDRAVWWPNAIEEFKLVEATYENLGIPEKCGIRIHEFGHETEPEAAITDIQAVAFLDRWLKSA
jgi:dienelactone hydrolase